MQLETYFTDNHEDVIFKVTKVLGVIMITEIRAEWLDQLIRKINEKWEFQQLVQQSNTLRV